MANYFFVVLKVLRKCQLWDAVQEKEDGLDSLGNAIDRLCTPFFGFDPHWYVIFHYFFVQLWVMDQIGVWDKGSYFASGEPCSRRAAFLFWMKQRRPWIRQQME